MMVDSGISDTMDPLAGFSITSLLPRTFKSFSLGPSSTCKIEDMYSLDARLTTMELKSPHRLLEQAKSVLDGHSEALHLENKNIGEKEDEICKDVAAVLNQHNPPARRPGLGRKRPQFFFKPDTSKTLEIPEINIDQFPDPEKYFAAVERRENAIREIQRLRGTALTELDQNVPARKRQKRPGLSRKTKRYSYSVDLSGDDRNLFSSQEAFSQESLNAADNCVGTETTDPGPAVGVENQAAHNYDELQSDHNEDSEDDELIKKLHEDFKPAELCRSSLPSLHDVRRREYKPCEETLNRTRNSTTHLSDFPNDLNSEGSLGGNKMLKSPPAAISLLKKRLFQSMPNSSAFKATDIDLPSSSNSSMNEKFDEMPNEVDIQKSTVPRKSKFVLQQKENILCGSVIENNIEDNGASDPMMQGVSNGAFDNAGNITNEAGVLKVQVPEGASSVDPNVHSEGVKSDQHAEHNAEDPDLEEIDQHAEPNSEHQQPEKIDQHFEPNAEELESEKINQHAESNAEALDPENIEQQAEPVTDNPEPEEIDHHAEPNSEDQEPEKIELHFKPNTEELESEKINQHAESNAEALDPENIALHADTDNPQAEKNCHDALPNAEPDFEKNELLRCLDEPPKTTHVAPKRNRRKRRNAGGESLQPCEGTDTEVHTRNKATVAQKSRGKRPVIDTTSLRRSNRVRTRPLQYWKGEKQLFGRVDDELITVIGAKMFSPDKESGLPSLKVKSYVSDEYKHLVDMAALH